MFKRWMVFIVVHSYTYYYVLLQNSISTVGVKLSLCPPSCYTFSHYLFEQRPYSPVNTVHQLSISISSDHYSLMQVTVPLSVRSEIVGRNHKVSESELHSLIV